MVDVGMELIGACCCVLLYSVLSMGAFLLLPRPSRFPLGSPRLYFHFTLGIPAPPSSQPPPSLVLFPLLPEQDQGLTASVLSPWLWFIYSWTFPTEQFLPSAPYNRCARISQVCCVLLTPCSPRSGPQCCNSYHCGMRGLPGAYGYPRPRSDPLPSSPRLRNWRTLRGFH